MNPTVTIVFSDIRRVELGTVKFDGEKLSASNEFAASMVEFYEGSGMTAADWVEKFSNWGNGYVFSEKILS